jgi:hypothetical protein
MCIMMGLAAGGMLPVTDASRDNAYTPPGLVLFRFSGI